MKKTYIGLLLIVVLMIATAGSGHALSGYVSQFKAAYPSSGSASLGCLLCHSSVPARNAYGNAFSSAGHNFQDIESLDSDGDGATNIAEINAGTNPGDPASALAPAPTPVPAPAPTTGPIPTLTDPVAPVPTGQHVFLYDPIAEPYVSADPAQQRPIGLGSAATGGDFTGIHTGLVKFTAPVDVYIGVYVPTIDPASIFLLGQDYMIQPASVGFVAWKKAVAGPVDEVIFRDAAALLQPGQYMVGVMVTPANDLNNYYLYATDFTVGGTDGSVLYSQKCASCHGPLATSTKTGRTATQIQAAIDAGVGGMGTLGTLTTAQVQAVAGALGTQTPPPPAPAPATIDGATLYAQSCASCHGPLAISTKAGRTAGQIRSAIDAGVGGMGGLSTLTAPQVQAIAAALAPEPINTASPGMASPASQRGFTNAPVDNPVLAVDPSRALPIGFGPAARGGDTVSVMVGLNAFTDPVDIYLAVALPGLSNNIMVVKEDYSVQPLAAGLEPWKKSVAGPITETLVDRIPQAGLAPGDYTFYLLAAPVNSINNYYLWVTKLGIGPPDGAKLYEQSCASCHGPLAASSKVGASAARIQAAINTDTGGMGGLSNLSAAQVQAIAGVLAKQAPPPSAPAPVTTDGATLYAQSCASCHGPLAASSKVGATAARIQGAISGNAGGMGTLSNLSAAQVQAIAGVLARQTTPAPTPTPAPAPGPATADGATLYAQSCASCHGPLQSSSKIGATAARIQGAISGNAGGMGTLSNLSAAQVQAIAGVLAAQAPPPPPTAADGPTLYAQNCAACHGALARSEVSGASASEIQRAIAKNKGGMASLASLTPAHIQAIAGALSGRTAAVEHHRSLEIAKEVATTQRRYAPSIANSGQMKSFGKV